jgi:hypothetical protein
MPLTEKIITMRRDEIRDRYLRDYKLRNPSASIEVGGAPYIDASTFADIEVVNHANAAAIARDVGASTATGAALDEKLAENGTERLPAVGASGYVKITASGSGARIEAGDEFKVNGKRYVCAVSDFYPDQAEVPITGKDTGPETDQPPGAVGKWSRPRPGLAQEATVVLLEGGHDAESDPEAQARLRSLKANPPAAGNDADVQAAALKCPGVPVEQCFTHPAISGPRTKAVVFTLRRTSVGGNRIPSALQRTLMKQHLVDRFGVEDAIFVSQLIAEPKTVVLSVGWSTRGGGGWADAVPFPHQFSGSLAHKVSAATSATAFSIAVPAGYPAPQVGQSIAFYDAAVGKFRRKKIATVGGPGPYAITCDTANGASDTTFTPAVNDPVMPWSDSLDLLVEPIRGYFDTLGPGEQVASFFDPGFRQRRSPPSPELWPSEVTTAIDTGVRALKQIANVVADGLADTGSSTVDEIPIGTDVGSATTTSYLLTFGGLAVYPI